ncbi:hypothetical protein [Lysobacter enzymogenes]|uniref:Uncharacterized protein n=1 Tax=Lysobacter enzymogenes TaxID=69 RepID=A0A3N2RD88_LYSEN|nr:hypothetical protein [Lysobacter enzymogenes]ROU05401.1 hypothetical protein D9T17_18435 [Lysobacter enzymogenes]
MNLLIGDKSTFAIETSFEHFGTQPFGNVLIWLGDWYVGAYEDPVPLLTFLSSLKRIPDLDVEANSGFLRSGDAFFDGVMAGTMAGGDKYRLSLGESFDDFSLLGYRDGGAIRIIWRLHEEPYFQYPSYPRGLQSACVPAEAFAGVVAGFEAAIGFRPVGS